MSEQQPLVDDVTADSVSTDSPSGTVYVVTCRRDGTPHAFVEAVYTSEAAAEAHKRWLADNAFREDAIAWGVHERSIETAFERGEAE
ncbi:hypothetical protein AFNJKBDN_CDS0037 [Halorubrum virus V_ICIS4]|nr:hypothetical protein AFNJKBDN_CDS0037 [Halorubrum virus V_ICIS4]